ncbi:hypothetical protein IAQ61_009056, partial [Plenodomus lingam]|uniref:Predicted protein n=1 Tax=Leptosphaeria maculans (strain JN3 / isolate v23.1.3 / race Av1-4-5-6-7-8) TaxID=985895 RepID=E4ZNY5_LEPMJ
MYGAFKRDPLSRYCGAKCDQHRSDAISDGEEFARSEHRKAVHSNARDANSPSMLLDLIIKPLDARHLSADPSLTEYLDLGSRKEFHDNFRFLALGPQ